MLDKETFKKNEGENCMSISGSLKKWSFWRLTARIFRSKLKVLKDIKRCNVYVSPGSYMSPSFSEKVTEGVAEKDIIWEIEKLGNELKYVSGKLRRNRARIRLLKRNIAPLKKVLTVPPLSKEMMDFIT